MSKILITSDLIVNLQSHLSQLLDYKQSELSYYDLHYSKLPESKLKDSFKTSADDAQKYISNLNKDIILLSNLKTTSMTTLKELSQDPITMDMTILDIINNKLVDDNTIIQQLLLGTILTSKQRFTLIMSKPLFRRLGNLNGDIDIRDIFDYTISAFVNSNTMTVKFKRL